MMIWTWALLRQRPGFLFLAPVNDELLPFQRFAEVVCDLLHFGPLRVEKPPLDHVIRVEIDANGLR